MIGVIQDITDRKLLENTKCWNTRTVYLNHPKEGFNFDAITGQITDANPSWSSWWICLRVGRKRTLGNLF
jgi:hypothetical protein